MSPEILGYLAGINPDSSKSLEYAHISLGAQLDMGLRNLELDVFHDPLGGNNANPKGLEIIKSNVGSLPGFDSEKPLYKPRLKLFHVQDLDFKSHYLLFADALRALKAWSELHPEHSPVFILINAKDSTIPGTRPTLPFTATPLDSIDLEIRTHLGTKKPVTLNLVRGELTHLEAALLAGNWPLLEAVKGNFHFVLDEIKEKIDPYLRIRPQLKGAVLFVNKKEKIPRAAF